MLENVKKNSRLLVNTCLRISAWAFKTSQIGKPKRHMKDTGLEKTPSNDLKNFFFKKWKFVEQQQQTVGVSVCRGLIQALLFSAGCLVFEPRLLSDQPTITTKADFQRQFVRFLKEGCELNESHCNARTNPSPPHPSSPPNNGAAREPNICQADAICPMLNGVTSSQKTKEATEGHRGGGGGSEDKLSLFLPFRSLPFFPFYLLLFSFFPSLILFLISFSHHSAFLSRLPSFPFISPSTPLLIFFIPPLVLSPVFPTYPLFISSLTSTLSLDFLPSFLPSLSSLFCHFPSCIFCLPLQSFLPALD